MEKFKKFSTVLFGFKKRTVLEYIYAQDTELKKQADACEAKTAENSELSEQLIKEREINKELSEKIESLLAEKVNYDSNVIKYSEAICMLQKKTEELQSELLKKDEQLRCGAERERKLKERLEILIDKCNDYSDRLANANKIAEAADKKAQNAEEKNSSAAAQAAKPKNAETVVEIKEEIKSFKNMVSSTLANIASAVDSIENSRQKPERKFIGQFFSKK